MAPIVTIIAPGAMGSAVAHRMHQRGATVRTSLAGRSAASARRAAECGMTDVASDRELVDGVDIVLSIVPPGEAAPLALRLKAVLSIVAHKPLVIDCNAVNPATVAEIASLLAPSGAPFVDGGIIGGTCRARMLRAPRSCATTASTYVCSTGRSAPRRRSRCPMPASPKV